MAPSISAFRPTPRPSPYAGLATCPRRCRSSCGKADYTVTLQRDILRLDAQVVTVATTVASQNAANAVAVVTAASVDEVPAPTIENSLEGKVPGAIIESNNGGAPGGGLEIQVRGITSIYGNAEPLYVIDGVIVNNQTIDAGENAINRSGGGVSSTGQTNVAGAPSPEDNGVNRIADINPDDIENIQILKGASASAIYGSKASAGVIIITTKRGTTGRAKWDVSGQVGHYSSANTYPFRQFPTLASAQSWYNNDIKGLFDAKTGRDTGAAVAANNAFIAGIYSPSNYQVALRQRSGIVPGKRERQRHAQPDSVLPLRPVEVRQRDDAQHGLQQAVLPHLRHQQVRAGALDHWEWQLHPRPPRRGISGNDNIGISPYDVFSYTPQFMNLNHVSPDGVWPTNPFGTANPFADAVDISTPQEVSRFIGSGSVQWTPWKTDHQSLQFNAVEGADPTGYSSLLYAPPTLQVEQQIATGLPGASVSNDATINYFNYSRSTWCTTTPGSRGWTRRPPSGSRANAQSIQSVTIGYSTLAGVNAPTVRAVHQNNFYFATAEKDQSLYAQEQILTLDSRLSVTAGVTAEKSTLNSTFDKFSPTASGGFKPDAHTVTHDFSPQSGDLANPVNGAIGTEAVLNDFLADVDTVNDLRFKAKFIHNPNPVQQQAV